MTDDVRIPKTVPKCLPRSEQEKIIARQGIGRGIGGSFAGMNVIFVIKCCGMFVCLIVCINYVLKYALLPSDVVALL